MFTLFCLHRPSELYYSTKPWKHVNTCHVSPCLVFCTSFYGVIPLTSRATEVSPGTLLQKNKHQQNGMEGRPLTCHEVPLGDECRDLILPKYITPHLWEIV